MGPRQRRFGRRTPGPGAGPAGAAPGRAESDQALDALLASRGRLVPDDPAWRPVADVLSALTAPPDRGELGAEARALAELRARPLRRYRLAAPRPGGRTMALLRAVGPATAVAAGAAVLGALTLGAYTGVLPAPVQRLAHDTIGAPAATAVPSPPGHAGKSSWASPAGPATASRPPRHRHAVVTASPRVASPSEDWAPASAYPARRRHHRLGLRPGGPQPGSPQSGSPQPGSPQSGGPQQGGFQPGPGGSGSPSPTSSGAPSSAAPSPSPASPGPPSSSPP